MINPQRGEVWLIDLEPIVGTEIEKDRPCLIVGDSIPRKFDLRVVVPITEWKENRAKHYWRIPLEDYHAAGLEKKSSIECHQIRSVSLIRFKRLYGRVDQDVMTEVDAGLKLVLEYQE